MSEAFRIYVTGGRRYGWERHEAEHVHRVLTEIYAKREYFWLAQGGATGADGAARAWADCAGIPCISYLAAWAHHGKKAGPIRNQFALEHFRPHLLIAFPGGPGTYGTVALAGKLEIPVRDEGGVPASLDARHLPHDPRFLACVTCGAAMVDGYKNDGRVCSVCREKETAGR